MLRTSPTMGGAVDVDAEVWGRQRCKMDAVDVAAGRTVVDVVD